MPILVNKKSHYYSFKMNVKVQNMHQACLLIIRTQVCDRFICLERVLIFRKHCLFVYISLAHYDYNVQSSLIEAISWEGSHKCQSSRLNDLSFTGY